MQFFPTDVFDEKRFQNAFHADWYASHLLSMHEKPLYPPTADGREVYRLLFLPSFKQPVVVRLNHAEGIWQATLKRTDGRGGFAPGHLTRMKELTFSATDASEFARLLERSEFWQMPSFTETHGLDGSQAMLEGVRQGTYHLVDRWSPRGIPYAELVDFLLDLDGA